MGLFKKSVGTLATGMGLTNPILLDWATGGQTHSGERVSVETVLQLDAVFACIRLVAQTISTLPVMLYERGSGAGQAIVATEHPLYRVIHDRPNADMTAVDFWTAMVANKLARGNAYAAITKRRTDNSVISLDPLPSDRVRIDRQRDGSRTYTYVFEGLTTVYQEEDILHLKGFSLDGYSGISAIAAGRQSLGTALSAERVAGTMFKNGMKPSGYLKIPQFLSAPQRQQTREYLQGFTGGENAGKIPMFEGGWEFAPLSIAPDDAQFLETRSFNVETICRWFGVPPSLIGHTEKSTTWGTGLEQINLGFLTYTLRAHLKEIEQALSMKCLTPGDQTRFYAEFNVEGLLRADSKGRAEYYRTMGQSGFMTPNEIRALENLPPKPGGDNLLVQGAMMPLDVLVQQAKVAKEIQKAIAAAGNLPKGEPGVSRDAAAVGDQTATGAAT
jgi:HK97 family phage portal protein